MKEWGLDNADAELDWKRGGGQSPPPGILELVIGSSTDLASVVPEMLALGTVRRVSIYDLSTRNLELLYQVDSIRTVEAE